MEDSTAAVGSVSRPRHRLDRRHRSARALLDRGPAWRSLVRSGEQRVCFDPLNRSIYDEQFQVLRDGDRFWYEWAMAPRLVAEVRATRLSDVIRRNTSIREEIPDDVFRVVTRPERPQPPRR